MIIADYDITFSQVLPICMYLKDIACTWLSKFSELS